MGRKKFQEGDLCKLNRSKATNALCNKFNSDTVLRVAGYDRGRRISSTNKYIVHPVGKENKETKIPPSYLKQYDGTVRGTGLQAQLETIEDKISKLEGKKREAENEKLRIEEKIEFKNNWGLDEFDEDLWNASKIYEVIHGDNRSREEKIQSIAHILNAC